MRVEAWLVWQHQRTTRAQIQILHIHFVLIERREIVHGRNGITWRESQFQNRIAVIPATIVHVKFSVTGNEVEKTLRVDNRRPSSLPDTTVGAIRGGEKDGAPVEMGGIVPKHPTVEIALIAERAERD